MFRELIEGRYPKKIVLKDGTELLMRPLAAHDRDALLSFFRQLSEEDRLYLADDVTDPQVVERWCSELDFIYVLPLLGLVNGAVVADAALHREKAGWKSHIGQVRIVVHPQHRGKGIAAALVKELIHVAIDLGLDKLDAEFVSQQDGALHAFERMGFIKVAQLPQHVLDRHGAAHDLILMVYDLKGEEAFAID
jgi:GNAT superfamily N-acetyltransferase